MRHLLIAFVFLFLLSCKQYKHCPAFDESQTMIGNYQTNNTKVFINDKGQTITFTITGKTLSGKEKKSCRYVGWGQQNCRETDCESSALINGYADVSRRNKNKLSISLKGSVSEIEENYPFQIQLLDLYVSGKYAPGFEVDNYIDSTTHEITSLAINGKTYYNTMIFSIDTTAYKYSNNLIWRLYFNKANGIIGFSDRETKSTFFLN